jgi:hypothetical protein
MFMGIPVSTIGATGLLAITVLMILSGQLIPRRVYKDKSDESDRWRTAYEVQREISIKSSAQTELLLEQGKTTHALITAIFSNSTAIRESGEQNVAS